MRESTQPQCRPPKTHGRACLQQGGAVRARPLLNQMVTNLLTITIRKLACQIGRCTHRTLQQSNLDTHTATHSGKLKFCFDCSFADKDQRRLMEHLEKCHGYEPNPTCYRSRRKSRRSAAAPYPSITYMTPLVEIPASLYLNDLTFPEYAGFMPFGSLSLSAEANDASFSGEFEELSLDGLFELPLHTFTHLHPPTVPANLTTFHIRDDPQWQNEDCLHCPFADMNSRIIMEHLEECHGYKPIPY
jgi:hypothetical protein